MKTNKRTEQRVHEVRERQVALSVANAEVVALDAPKGVYTHQIVMPAGKHEVVYMGWVISVGGFWWDPDTRQVRRR